MEKRICMEMKVYGRVQGVGFRYYTKRVADELGVSGWVRNEYDETVFIVAEGEPAAMDRFVGWVKNGPPSARVDRVESKRLHESRNFSCFEVRF